MDTAPKRVCRVRIVLVSVGGIGTSAIAAAADKAKTTVWRPGLVAGQAQAARRAARGLRKDRDCRGDDAQAAAHEATHRTARHGQSRGAVNLHDSEDMVSSWPRPRRWWQFKLSTDLAFAENCRTSSGLYAGTVRDFVFCRKTEMRRPKAGYRR